MDMIIRRLMAVAALVVLVGCNQGGKHAAGGAADSVGRVVVIDTTVANVPDTADLTGVAPGRPSLIAQLKAIQRLLATGDKRVIARVLSLPVPFENGYSYFSDTNLDNELYNNNRMMTAGIFIRHFAGIDAQLRFDEYSRVFQELTIDSLMRRDTLERLDDRGNLECFRWYGIEVEDSMVYIRYGVKGYNPDYKPDKKDSAAQAAAGKAVDSAAGKDGSADDDNNGLDDTTCNHSIFWVYRFDGRRLHLIKYDWTD
jgi:hypothetical protein